MVAPNIQKLERAERILIELPGIKEPERLRKLLQGSANLEFWKTYNVKELINGFNEINSRTSAYVASKQTDASTEDVAVETEEATEEDVLAEEPTPVVKEDAVEWGSEDVTIDKSFIEYFAEPYFAMGGASVLLLVQYRKMILPK